MRLTLFGHDVAGPVFDLFIDFGHIMADDAQADQLNAAGDNRSAQIMNQVWEILLSALEQMEDMLAQTHWE